MTDEPAAFDLRAFAVQALEIAKENLRKDGHLVPVAFLISPGGVDVVDASFDNEEQKVARHQAIVAAARASNASAIVTINDAHIGGKATDREGYYWGKLAAERAPECLLVTISGPAMTTWNLVLPYRRTAGGITFGEPAEEYGTELNFLPGWPGGPGQPS